MVYTKDYSVKEFSYCSLNSATVLAGSIPVVGYCELLVIVTILLWSHLSHNIPYLQYPVFTIFTINHSIYYINIYDRSFFLGKPILHNTLSSKWSIYRIEQFLFARPCILGAEYLDRSICGQTGRLSLNSFCLAYSV